MFTLNLPGLHWPHPDTLPPLDLPGLNTLMRFGRFQAAPATPADFCFRQLNVHLSRPGRLPYAFASPVWQQAGMHSVQILDSRVLAVSAAEAAILCDGLNRLYAEDGWRFEPLRPDLWLLNLPEAAEWQAPCVLDIVGQADGTQRAVGSAQAQWLQRQTEIQMWLHGQAVNQQRQADGLPPINGLWLWDSLPAEDGRTAARLIGSDSPWAAFSRSETTPAPESWAAWQAETAARGLAAADTALYLDALATAAQCGDAHAYHSRLEAWEHSLFTPLWQDLQRGRLPALCLQTDGPAGGRLLLNARSGRRFWKRKKTFAGSLAA
ncbi:MAG: hypothetical protein Q4A62_05160 [Eikenella sp.]|nr:hypothetical protein [Eikenella sp.]